MPTSFEHKIQDAHIRYWVGGIINTYRPWASNVYTHRTFMFLNNYDLNQLGPMFRLPLVVLDSKIFGVCFCKSKPINVSLKINKSIF